MKLFSSYSRVFFFLLIAGGILAFPLAAHAQTSFLGDLFNIGDIAGYVIGKAFGVVAYIIGFLGGLVLNLFSWIAGIMMDLNLQVFDPQNKLVEIGWEIMRDLANLGFVLIIIVIAFGVMFRVEKYGSQKLLVRLIAAAILVNFSLAIAGAVLQFTNVFTAFFLNRIPSPNGLGAALAGAFNPQRLNDPQNFESAAGAISTFGAGLFNLIAGQIFNVVFVFLSVVVVGTFAIMLLLRYLHLTFLGITAPIIWLFWVMPNLGNYFQDWWKDFIKWATFAPIATFFIYLAFAALEAMGGKPAPVADGSNFFDAGLISIMSQGVQMFVLAGIMLGGLIVAQKMGVAGANIGMAIANKAKTGAQAWAGRQAKQAGARALESKLGTGLAGRLQRIPGFKRMGMALGGQADVLRRGLVDDADKRLKKYGDAHLAKNLDTLSAPEKVAAMERLAKNGTVGLIQNRTTGKPDVLGNVTQKNKEVFESYYGKESRQWKGFEVAAGMDLASADILRSGDMSKPEDKKKLDDAMAAWIEKLKPDEIPKLPTNDTFGKAIIEQLGAGTTKEMSDAFRQALVHGIAVNVPADVAKLFRNVKGAGFERLDVTIDAVGAQLIAEGNVKAADKLAKVQNQIASLRLYDTGTAAAPATPAAAPPPPPSPPPSTP
ncbi:MAG: hypothetical protein V1885_02915 [Candidatus Brennerbacteria bacterium]